MAKQEMEKQVSRIDLHNEDCASKVRSKTRTTMRIYSPVSCESFQISLPV